MSMLASFPAAGEKPKERKKGEKKGMKRLKWKCVDIKKISQKYQKITFGVVYECQWDRICSPEVKGESPVIYDILQTTERYLLLPSPRTAYYRDSCCSCHFSLAYLKAWVGILYAWLVKDRHCKMRIDFRFDSCQPFGFEGRFYAFGILKKYVGHWSISTYTLLRKHFIFFFFLDFKKKFSMWVSLFSSNRTWRNNLSQYWISQL